MGRDADLDKELGFHLEQRTADLEAAGVPADEARRRARLEFGGVLQVKEAVRDQHVSPILDGLWQDIRLAFRGLSATPFVSSIAVMSLALGIGANTTLYSLVNSLLLRPLPIRESGRLVVLSDTATAGTQYWRLSVAEEIRQRPDLFEMAAALAGPVGFTRTDGAETEPISGAWVSGSYLGMLGVRAEVGRLLTPEDDRPGGGASRPVMVISDAFWRRRASGAIHR